MKRELYKNLGCFSNLGVVVYNEPSDPEFVPDTSELSNILNEIFAVDVVTGLPKGDLAYYLSPDGNPSVKIWLENNLLKPSFGKRFETEGLTDDIIAEFARKPSETTLDYASRLQGYKEAALKEAALQNDVVDIKTE